jgi:hypothetical protein
MITLVSCLVPAVVIELTVADHHQIAKLVLNLVFFPLVYLPMSMLLAPEMFNEFSRRLRPMGLSLLAGTRRLVGGRG